MADWPDWFLQPWYIQHNEVMPLLLVTQMKSSKQ